MGEQLNLAGECIYKLHNDHAKKLPLSDVNLGYYRQSDGVFFPQSRPSEIPVINTKSNRLLVVDMFEGLRTTLGPNEGLTTYSAGLCTPMAFKLQGEGTDSAQFLVAHAEPGRPRKALRSIADLLSQQHFSIKAAALSLQISFLDEILAGVCQSAPYYLAIRPPMGIGALVITNQGGIFFRSGYDFGKEQMRYLPAGSWSW